MRKFKIGDKVRVAHFGPKSDCTNHGNKKIGDIFTVVKISSLSKNSIHTRNYNVDYYVMDSDNTAISNRDLEFAKVTDWRKRIENG